MSRSVKEWIGKNDGTPVPPRVRLRVFEAKGGKCHRCGRKINGAVEKWTCEHVKAIINGGPNRESNLDLTCSNCLQPKNAEDVAEKSAVATTRKKHLGVTNKKPWPKRQNPWGKMRDPRDTVEFQIEYAAHDVRRAVSNIVNYAKQYPHLVREELAELSNANDDLAVLVATLTVKEAAE